MFGKLKIVAGWLMLMQIAVAHAAMNIEIIGAGEHQIPVTIELLKGDTQLASAINEVVRNDLQRTGLFRLVDAENVAAETAEVNYADLRNRGTEVLTRGTVELKEQRIEAKLDLLDVVKQLPISSHNVTATAGQHRAIGHRIADLIYEKLTGDKGVFSTRIAYVNRLGNKYNLVIEDSDGENEQILLTQKQPIMSPVWSPDGQKIAYVSFEKSHAVVYVQWLYKNQRKVIANFRGSNSAPAWSPDGEQLAVVLTRDGGSQIYLVSAEGGEVKRITSGGGIDTEPNFSPDGKSLLFSSDRGGTPQIYRMSVKGEKVQRMTFGGGSNYSPRYSPDGKGFVFTHQIGGKFYIATQDFQSGIMTRLSAGGWEKRPSFAPNGKLILFSSEQGGRGILATVSSDGRVKQKMISQSGDAREPIWGPWL